jgi:hypothetical protein
MNTFLLMARFGSVDLPVSLHATYDAALAAAVQLEKNPSRVNMLEIADGWDPDLGDFLHAEIVEFAHGRPVRCFGTVDLPKSSDAEDETRF